MDSKRFDTWTRNRALRLSRRDALRVMGAGGAAAALPVLQSNALAQGTCTLTIHAETAAGPSAPTTYDGALQFTLNSDGTFGQASFAPASGGSQAVTGHATGRVIDLQIALAGNQMLSLSGVSDRPISTCQATVAGILSGPQPGDLGGWQATMSGGAPTTTSVTTSGQTTTNTNPPPGSSCPAPSFPCGPNCCPGGATCADTNQGICSCPNGTTQCGFNCVPDCPDDQTLDLDSCTCISSCTQDGNPCEFDSECCGGGCRDGVCGACPGLLCGDMGCVDQMSDPNNCGSCGNVCANTTATCTGGVCSCSPDGEPCSYSDACCSQVCSDGHCGCTPIQSACTFSGSACCNDGHCLNGVCCLLTGSACSSDSDCCFSDPSSLPRSACVNGVCGQAA